MVFDIQIANARWYSTCVSNIMKVTRVSFIRFIIIFTLLVVADTFHFSVTCNMTVSIQLLLSSCFFLCDIIYHWCCSAMHLFGILLQSHNLKAQKLALLKLTATSQQVIFCFVGSRIALSVNALILQLLQYCQQTNQYS